MEDTIVLTEPTISTFAAKKLDKKFIDALDKSESGLDESIDAADDVRKTLAYKLLGFKTFGAWYKDRARNRVSVMRDRLDQWIIEQSEAGKTQREIAKETGVSQQTVGRTIKKDREANVIQKRKNGSLPPVPKPDPAKEYNTPKPQGPLLCPTTMSDSKRALREIRGWMSSMTLNPTRYEIRELRKLLLSTLTKLNKLEQELAA
jgi:hypothetical protein